MEKRNLIKAILVEAVKRHLAEMPQIKKFYTLTDDWESKLSNVRGSGSRFQDIVLKMEYLYYNLLLEKSDHYAILPHFYCLEKDYLLFHLFFLIYNFCARTLEEPTITSMFNRNRIDKFNAFMFHQRTV